MKSVLLMLVVGLALSQRLRGATKALIEEEQTFYDTQEEQQFYISDFVSDQKPEKQQTIEASVAVFQDHEDPKVYIDAQNDGEQNAQDQDTNQNVEESIAPKFEQPSLEIQPQYMDDVEQGAAQQNDDQIANTWNQENDSSFGKESKQEFQQQDMEVVVQNDNNDQSQQYDQQAQNQVQQEQTNNVQEQSEQQQQYDQQDPYQEEQNFENQEEDVKQAPKKMPEVVISKPAKALESHHEVKHVYVYNPLAKKPFVGIIYPPVAVTKDVNYLGNFDVRSIHLPKWSDISNHKVEDELEFFQFIRKSDPSKNEY